MPELDPYRSAVDDAWRAHRTWSLTASDLKSRIDRARNSALLLGHLNTARLERSVSFKMDQVQAHVVCSEMDQQRGPLWLQIANGKLSTPPGAEGIMRQVLLPFKVRTARCGACARSRACDGSVS